MNEYWTGERMEPFVYEEATLEHLHRYALAMNFAEGKVVLDIACGEGYGANLIAEKAEKVIGIDIDETTINNAAKKYKRPNLVFKKGSATNLPLEENQFDVIISFETIEHIEQQDQMLTEIKKVLKPGGLLIISTPDKKTYSDETGFRNKFHVKELYKEEFISLIQGYFKYQKVLQQNFVHGSLILGNDDGSIKIYEGNFDGIDSRIPNTLFWIILASDESIEEVSSSVFHDKEFLNKILEAEIASLKRTFTYRFGHFLLLPFKWMVSIFRS